MSEELTAEQIAENEAADLKVKEEQEKQDIEKKATKAEQLRKLSKEYGFDAFKPEEVKSKLEEFTKWQDSQKTEQERIQAELDTLKENEDVHKKEKQTYEDQIAGLELGIPKEKLNDALALARNNLSDGQTIKDGLKAIQEKYKDMFVNPNGVTLEVGSQMRDEDPNKNKKIDPALARYLALQEKKKSMRNK
jgi:molecular chaperone GrpE (heat shock protein)